MTILFAPPLLAILFMAALVIIDLLHPRLGDGDDTDEN